jgi:hypothetical protein
MGRLLGTMLLTALLASPQAATAQSIADSQVARNQTLEASAVATSDAPIDAETARNAYPLAVQGPMPEPIVPPAPDEIRASIARGVDLLLKIQRSHGAWGGPQRTKGLNIYAPVPGAHLAFRTGVTGLAVMALLESRGEVSAERRAAIDAAVDRGQSWLLEHSGALRRAEPMALYNVWGHSYALHALRMLVARAEGDAALQSRLTELARYHVDRLQRYNYINGGWGYYDFVAQTQIPSGSPNSFTTATALIALKEAKALDIDYPERLTQKAIDSIIRQRLPDYSYAYGEYLRMVPRMDINRPGGSLGRTQACNYALRLYGREEVTDEIVKTWLNRLFARNGWLSNVRKRPVPHEGQFAVAGYFYYYGHWHAALCLELLPEAERPYFRGHLAHILLPLQEKDGSWWDYPLYDYHQTWGTAMAVSSLVRCLPADQAAP